MKTIKIEMKWALLFSGMTLLWMVLEKAAGLHGKHLEYHYYLTNLFAIPAIWVMVLALKDKKQRHYMGNMSYKDGLISGIKVSLFIMLLSPAVQWVITYIITPEYFENVIPLSVELGYFENEEAAKENFNYENYAIQGAISAFILGVLTTAIAMIFIKTKSPKN